VGDSLDRRPEPSWNGPTDVPLEVG